MSKIKLVVFDWNGTILDDAEAGAYGLELVLRELGDNRENVLQLQKDHHQIPVSEMYASLGYEDIKTEDHQKLSVAWQKGYEAKYSTISLMPGISETLQYLETKNIETAILSNHFVDNIKHVGEKVGVKFDTILANSNHVDAHTKGKLHRIEKYLEDNKLDPGEVLIIGDSEEEYVISKVLETKCILFENGWVSSKRFRHAECKIINSKDLPEVIKEFVG